MPIIGNLIKRSLQARKKMNFKQGEPLQYQLKVLKKLLRTAQDTEFGRNYDFSMILDSENIIDTYQKVLPLHDYKKMYNEWWSKALEGQEDVFWPGKIKYFALSSGTSEGSSKYIPVTKDMLRAITKASIKQLYSMTNFNLPSWVFEKAVFTLGSSTDLDKMGQSYVGDMSGISADKAIPFIVQRFFKPGKKINRKRDWDEKLEEIAKNAPKWDIGAVAGIPVWVQLMMEKIIEQNHAESIHDIWPNLRVYIHGGIAFDPYRKNFEKLFREPMTYIETYMASEGYFAFRARPETRALQLILNNGHFYEFVPFNSRNFDENGDLKADAEVLDISEVEEQVEYAILLSTVSGAWRYLIGDTIKFEDARRKEILITGRTKHFLSICGEHLSIDNMVCAIQKTAEDLGISIPEFTVSGIPHGNLFAHKWYIGTDDEADPQKIRALLDGHLRELNDDYATERDNVLKDLQIELVPTRFFYEFLESEGKIGDQVKFPRVMKGERFRVWEDFVKSHR